MGFKERYEAEMASEHLSEEAREKILRSIRMERPQVRKERHMKLGKPFKIVLAAALVCAALMVTAVAAPGGFGRRIRDNGDGTRTLVVTEKIFEKDEVSQEAREKLGMAVGDSVNEETGEVQWTQTYSEIMGSWREIQEHVGVDLVDSAILDEAPLANYWALQSYTVDYSGDHIDINRRHIVDGTEVSLSTNIFLEGYRGLEAGSADFTTGADSGEKATNYTSPNGIDFATSVTKYENGTVYCSAWFICDGIAYSLSVEDLASRLETAEYIAVNGLANAEYHYGPEAVAAYEQYLPEEGTVVDYESVFYAILDSLV